MSTPILDTLLETHARERRLLKCFCSGLPIAYGWADFYDGDFIEIKGDTFHFELDTDGCPIISDEMNAALKEALGEGAKP